MARYSDNIYDEYRRPVPNAQIYVYNQQTGELAVLEDDDGSPLANPVRTNHDGFFYFNTADGVYVLRVVYKGVPRFRDKAVQVGDGIPLPDSVLLALEAPSGAALVGSSGPSNVQADLDARPTYAEMAATGGSLVGFSHDENYAAGSIGKKDQQIVSPLDKPFGATADGVADDTTAIDNTRAALLAGGQMLLPAGRRARVTSFSNDLGVDIAGGGQVVIGSGSAAYQINKPYRVGPFYGLGNDYAVKNAINTAGTAWDAFIYGDSTVATTENGGVPGGIYTPDILLTHYFREHGVRNLGTFTNRAVGGTTWNDPDPVADLGPNAKLMLFKFFINHESGQSVEASVAAMRAKLAAIRADANGTWDKVTIGIISGNSTHDTAGGRTNAWYPLLRDPIEQACWDYGCFGIDLFGLFPDSRRWAGFYADTPAVHPQVLLTQQLWAYVGAALLPEGGLQVSTGSRWVPVAFQNGWTAYDNGFHALEVSLKQSGRVVIQGATAPPGGTVTAGQPFGVMPNTNYYANRSTMLTAWAFDGSTFVPLACGTDAGGTLYSRVSASGISALLFDSQSWQTW